MKANEAPEKIYINPNLENRTWLIGKGDISFIEYINTDVFIKKACEYLMEYEFNDSPTIADRRKRIDEFRKYMEGG